MLTLITHKLKQIISITLADWLALQSCCTIDICWLYYYAVLILGEEFYLFTHTITIMYALCKSAFITVRQIYDRITTVSVSVRK